MFPRVFRLVPFFVLAALSLGCVWGESLPFEPAGPQAAPDPAQMGPYPVGVRTITLIDDTRSTPGKRGARRLVSEVWYPATEDAREMPTETYVLYDYVPDDMRDSLKPEDLGELPTAAVRGAVPRADGAPYPLIVFSHGKGGIRMQSTFYTVFLASHGYVVIAPDHEGDTILDQLEEGDFDPGNTFDDFLLRPEDVSVILDAVEDRADYHPIFGLTSTEVVGVTGHSFGALTSFRSAGSDSRIDAIVPQTPVGYGVTQAGLETNIEDFGIPIMMMSGGKDETLPSDMHADSLWEHMKKPRFHLHLKSAGHFTYSDLCVLDVEAINAAIEDIDVSNVLNDGCADFNVDTKLAFPIIRNYGIGFFNRFLRGSEGSAVYLEEGPGKKAGGDEVVFMGDP
jgi:predicted dienelactone hydrolase